MSMQPDAVRKRAYRDRMKSGTVPTSQPALTSVPAQAAPTASVATLWDTGPVSASGPESFASVPLIDDSKPFVSPTPEPAAAPMSPEDVAPIANGVALVFQLGATALIAKNPQLLTLVPGGAASVDKHFADAVLFVHGAATREAMRMGIRLPHQDLIVCAGALGIGVFGLVSKPAKNSNAQVVRDVPRDAKDANAPTDAGQGHEDTAPATSDGADDDAEIILD